MPIHLNHTIVPARDPMTAASFLAELLGLERPGRFGPFYTVPMGNGVTLDFMRAEGPIHTHHYAFLVSEQEFDEIFARIKARDLTYWADPGHHAPGQINHRDGGRGVYWSDPNGHNLEIITRPYGSGG